MSVGSSFIGGARPRDPAVGTSFMGMWPHRDQSRAGDELDAWVLAPPRAFMYRRGGSQCQGN